MAGRILIADNVATNRIVLKANLASAFYDVSQSADGAQTIRIAIKESPDLIILSSDLPDKCGITVCEALRRHPETREIPIIIVSSSSDPNTRLLALKAGADEFISKPIHEEILLAKTRSILRARGAIEELRENAPSFTDTGFAEASSGFATQGQIAIISADPARTETIQQSLANQIRDRVETLSPDAALKGFRNKTSPDVILLAANSTSASEMLRLLSELKSRQDTRYTPIVMLLENPHGADAISALDLGAHDIVGANVNAEELALRLRTQLKRKRQADKLRENVQDGLRMAVIDPLTGLYNRRYALPHLKHIANRAKGSQRDYAVMMLDLDRFKQVNDTYGHAAGDAVIREVAERIRASLRSVDLVARYGGEEFLIAMPETSLEQARIAAERVRRIVEATPISIPGTNHQITATLSIGVAIADSATQTPDDLLKRADSALYVAKSDGRNQVSVSEHTH
ncbi:MULTISPECIES: diguanylate cyclase [Halocynthiibacter]|uniref:diguanylate cyclase n=1 Tax=Halocynthiibacter halioticoli TaxID=2986804 RepID=A0AAE3J1G3_9RHOB|nr:MULTISPECIES: diguanylate cyclase [Halocynthiibacter]MCV6824975.1 diguanylate cyclase [Halocynthiibacter halioticoli]MCW4057976.1 diguanylate cyclase [Halocynthiibacter sp. SDUM655004]